MKRTSLPLRRRQLILLLSGATAWPLVALADKPVPVIGYISTSFAGAGAVGIAGFRQGLSETGYVDGQNIAIEFRWAEGHYDRYPALVDDLVGRKVGLIYAASGPAALVVKQATSTIPTVFLTGGDPVAGSCRERGGNLKVA
jgi:putative ABC transport system substrate-binding protein